MMRRLRAERCAAPGGCQGLQAMDWGGAQAAESGHRLPNCSVVWGAEP